MDDAELFVAVPHAEDPTRVVWKALKELLPDYRMTAFPDEIRRGLD